MLGLVRRDALQGRIVRGHGHVAELGSHPSATVPRVTPTTTNGRLARRSSATPAGSGRPSSRGSRHGAGALGVDVAAQLGEERLGAQEFEDVQTLPCGMHDPRVDRWAASGAMALTGTPEEPLGPPGPLVDGLERLARPFDGLDTVALLGERAALMGLWRRGSTSCGGSCHLFATAEGWMAVSLPRAEDMEMLPAWLELDDMPSTAARRLVCRRRAPGRTDPTSW